MSRPESILDIELDDVQFAQISMEHISADGPLLKAYATFMESVQKNGAEVEVRYNTAYFTRRPTLQEQNAQLKSAQTRWDDGKKHYETLAAVGELEYSWYRTAAQSWAEREGMPFPPDHDPIESIDVMIRDEVEA